MSTYASSYLAPRPTAVRYDERSARDWLELLGAQLNVQAMESAVYEDFYDGVHPMQYATSKYREAFGNLFSAFADNWCQIVVDAPVERLNIVGFQVKGEPSKEAWDIWQENGLDAESGIAHTECGKSGRAYLLVDRDAEDGPRITVEHSSQVVVAHDPSDRRRRVAALKRWLGDDGYAYATLYLPNTVLKFESKEPIANVGYDVAWEPRTNVEANMVLNQSGVVPMIPLLNKPGLVTGAHSDLEPAIPLQNAVNKLCSDLIVTSEYGAYPQRVATGVEVPKDPATGEPIASEQQVAAMSRLWTFDKPTVNVTSLPAADLRNFVVAIEMLIQHLAAQTRTPPHYLLGQIVNASGDALSTAEAGLVSKCRGKIKTFSDAWEEAFAIALGGNIRRSECEVMWANPERVSGSQLADAAAKKQSVGVPLEVIWLELGYTPDQIVTMKQQYADEQEALVKIQERLAATRVGQGQNPAGAAPRGTGAGG